MLSSNSAILAEVTSLHLEQYPFNNGKTVDQFFLFWRRKKNGKNGNEKHNRRKWNNIYAEMYVLQFNASVIDRFCSTLRPKTM